MNQQPQFIAEPRRRKILWVIPIGDLCVRLTAPLTVWISGYSLTIPKDFLSDGASVPRLFWRLIPKYGSWLRGAIVHDYLYRTGILTKDQSDAVLWELAAADGTPWWQCFVIEAGLWLGGKPQWNKYARMRESGIDLTMEGDLNETPTARRVR